MTDYHHRKYNTAAAIAHLVVLILEIVIVTVLYDEKNSFDTTAYVTSKHRNDSKVEVVTSRPVIPGWNYLLPGLLYSFTGVTALAHTLYATKLHRQYQVGVQNCNVWFRWVEYSLSATIMLVIIALSSGVSDANALFAMSIVSVGVMLLGHITEKQMANNDLATAKLSTLLAWLLFAAAWSFVFVQYAEQLYQVKALAPVQPTDLSLPAQKISIPSFVTALVITMFGLYSSFGLVQLVQLYQRSQKKQLNFAPFDKSYIILSFVAKTVLPIIFTVGLVQRSQNTNSRV